MIYGFPKMDFLGKNGVCLEKSLKKHLKNLMKCILKQILSQLDVLSFQKCVHGVVQQFSTGTSKIILV